jgi:hypothetical protein
MAGEQQELFGRAEVVVLSEYRQRHTGERTGHSNRLPDWAPKRRRVLSGDEVLHRQRMLRHLERFSFLCSGKHWGLTPV